MTGLIIALAMVVITTIAMITDLYGLHRQVKKQIREYNELKKRL